MTSNSNRSPDGVEELPPLRAILHRKFVAYEGTHYLLACRHVVIRSGNSSVRKMRCPDCREALARSGRS